MELGLKPSLPGFETGLHHHTGYLFSASTSCLWDDGVNLTGAPGGGVDWRGGLQHNPQKDSS